MVLLDDIKKLVMKITIKFIKVLTKIKYKLNVFDTAAYYKQRLLCCNNCTAKTYNIFEGANRNAG